MAEQKLDGYSYQTAISDTLEVIKTLTNKCKQTEGNEEVYALWYEIFP